MAKVRKRTWISGGQERQAWVVDFKDQTDRRRTETFRLKKQADARLQEILKDVNEGTYTHARESVTVSEACKSWLDRCENGTAHDEALEPSTTREYRRVVEQHIKDPEIGIGNRRLVALTPQLIRQFENHLVENGRSRALVRKVMGAFSTCLSDAIDTGLTNRHIIREMTGKRRKRRKRERSEVVIPTKSELQAMLNAADGSFRPLFITLLFTGMRISEARGLTWDHVDLKGGIIKVRQRADNIDNQIGPPKSDAGHRDIPMAPMVKNTLKHWKVKCPKGDLNLVFPNQTGNITNYGNLYRRRLIPLQLQAGVTVPVVDSDGKPKEDEDGNPIVTAKYGFHVLRHVAASLFIEQGFTPKKIQKLMGHASIQMTFDTYGHLFPSPDDDAKAFKQIEARLIKSEV